MGTNAVLHAPSSGERSTAKMQPASVSGQRIDAEAVLKAMKQSTRRLDEILQQLCAAERLKNKDARSERGSDDSGVDKVFVDAYEQQQELSNNNGDMPVDMDVGMMESDLASVDAYFQAIDHILTAAASNDDPIRVHISQGMLEKAKEDTAYIAALPLANELNEASQSQKAIFAAQTKNTTFCFLKSGDQATLYMARSTAMLNDAPPPVGKHEFQWGLLVMLQTRSLLRAHTPTESAETQELVRGALITALAQLTLFLPKSRYTDADNDNSEDDGTSSAISTSTDVYFAKHVMADSAKETPLRDRARRIAETGTPGSFSLRAPGTRALPELVAVYVKGTPAVDDDKDPSLPSVAERCDDFVRLTIDTPFPRARIVQAACSRFHTLLLSDVGMVFAFGQSVDGALGLGDASSMNSYVRAPRLVDFFFDNLISVSCIACGGDPMAGAHSAAVSTDGRVYTWGVGTALGNGSIRSHSEPQFVRFPELEVLDTNGEEVQRQGENETRIYAPPKIESIACGGGFCVAVSDTGHAFAWGKWSDGRLGLGKIPILNQSSRKFGRRRQFQSFQLTPKQLILPTRPQPSSSMSRSLFLKVSCGDAHCVALMRDGAILTWGRGNHGQLGHGTAHNSLAPVEVAIAKEPDLVWRDVVADENWSMALDVHGHVWTWGACGGTVLGHGNGVSKTAVVTETILQRHHRLLKQASTKSEITPPPLPELNWMRPQLVPSFGNGGIEIQQISAGLQHAAVVSTNGDLYQWGEKNGWSSLPTLVHAGRESKIGNSSSAVGSSTIGTEIVERVVCGGNQVIVFTSGTFLARSLQQLYRRCELLSSDHQELGQSAFKEVTSQLATGIVLLISGKRLFAHQFLLARRSRVLRDLILDEQRNQYASSSTGDDSDNEHSVVMELLLPQLRYDIAQILLECMYTDNFSAKLDPQSYLVRDVLRAAQTFELPSLEMICRDILDGSSAFGAGIELFPSKEKELANEANKLGERRTLNRDFHFALGNATFSDTTIVAEGKEIPVHRCVLIARSEYFRALLGFHVKQHGGQQQKKVIHVDESYLGMLRILKFIYNDHVTASHSKDDDDRVEQESDATEQLIEDLIAADKYGLARFKRLCEHSIHVNVANCLDVLAVADLVSAVHLKQVRKTNFATFCFKKCISAIQGRVSALARRIVHEHSTREYKRVAAAGRARVGAENGHDKIPVAVPDPVGHVCDAVPRGDAHARGRLRVRASDQPRRDRRGHRSGGFLRIRVTYRIKVK
ncbi:Transmembrane protein, partial [Globisporangium splendens]